MGKCAKLPVMSENSTDKPAGERIAKVMARAGLCSRREAERWIEQGRVAVGGTVLDSPAVVVTQSDIITVDDKPIAGPEQSRLWRYHKPVGLVTTHKDPQGRSTVFEKMPSHLPRVISVGRLDLNSEGLLLMTNDGEMARKLELPSNDWARRYRVRVRGTVNEDRLAALSRGITISGIRYSAIEAVLDSQTRTNAWLTVTLHEGKNREIRKVMEHLGLEVGRLIRISYGPFQLGNLERGEVAEIPGKTVREQLGRGKGVKTGGEKTGRAKAKTARTERSGTKGKFQGKKKATSRIEPRVDGEKQTAAQRESDKISRRKPVQKAGAKSAKPLKPSGTSKFSTSSRPARAGKPSGRKPGKRS